MVSGAFTNLDDMLASQYQSIDWTQHTTCQSIIISIGGTFWLLVPCIRKLHTIRSMLGPVKSTGIVTQA